MSAPIAKNLTNNDTYAEILPMLTRIAIALERLAPATPNLQQTFQHLAYVWDGATLALKPISSVSHITLNLLCGIDDNTNTLLENTRRFANSLSANNALLWGARGMGKSSLIKAIHAHINSCSENRLILVEIHREDISTLGTLLDILRNSEERLLLFCDDLSFDNQDQSYKSLKALLDGGVEGRPENVLFYATSNLRHLLKRDMIENEQSTAIHPGEAVEEKVSLSDRFGLWLGFHSCSQGDYFTMVKTYAHALNLSIPEPELESDAREWQVTRGSRSGRVAWQFIQDLAGRHGVNVNKLKNR